MSGFRTRMFAWTAVAIGPAWLRWARQRYRQRAAPLSATEQERLGPFFDSDLLALVRIARVNDVDLPLVGLARRLSAGLMPLDRFGGIALIDTVVVANRDENLATLFHELVHIAQYRRLGVRRFLREYIGGWAVAGCSYFDIPLEVQAYALQDRYVADPYTPFSVELEVETFARSLHTPYGSGSP